MTVACETAVDCFCLVPQFRLIKPCALAYIPVAMRNCIIFFPKSLAVRVPHKEWPNSLSLSLSVVLSGASPESLSVVVPPVLACILRCPKKPVSHSSKIDLNLWIVRSVDFSTSSAGPSDTYILIIKCRYRPGPSDTDILSSSGSIKDLFYVNMFGCICAKFQNLKLSLW